MAVGSSRAPGARLDRRDRAAVAVLRRAADAGGAGRAGGGADRARAAGGRGGADRAGTGLDGGGGEIRGRGPDAARVAIPDAVAAAQALWKLAKAGTPEALAAIGAGADHADWRVRRLSAGLVRRYASPNRADVLGRLAADPVPAVRIEAVRGLAPERIAPAIEALAATDAVHDDHVRYEMASVLARHLDVAVLRRILVSTDDSVQRLAECAIDIAAYERTPRHEAAIAALLDPRRWPPRSARARRRRSTGCST
jgi:hypothetical protein